MWNLHKPSFEALVFSPVHCRPGMRCLQSPEDDTKMIPRWCRDDTWYVRNLRMAPGSLHPVHQCRHFNIDNNHNPAYTRWDGDCKYCKISSFVEASGTGLGSLRTSACAMDDAAKMICPRFNDERNIFVWLSDSELLLLLTPHYLTPGRSWYHLNSHLSSWHLWRN